MSNTYRATTDHGVAMYGADVFEKDWTPSEEKDQLNSGHVELVPRTYRVLSDNFSGGTKNGEYTAALHREVEEALISGQHIARKEYDATSLSDTEVVTVADGGDTTFKDGTAEGGKAAKK